MEFYDIDDAKTVLLMAGISRQLKENGTETEFGEYQSWVYLFKSTGCFV